MKKTLLIILALIMVLAFTVGCGNNNDSAASDANGTAVVTDDDEETYRASAGALLDSVPDLEGAVLDLDEGETQRAAGSGISIDDMNFR